MYLKAFHSCECNNPGIRKSWRITLFKRKLWCIDHFNYACNDYHFKNYIIWARRAMALRPECVWQHETRETASHSFCRRAGWAAVWAPLLHSATRGPRQASIFNTWLWKEAVFDGSAMCSLTGDPQNKKGKQVESIDKRVDEWQTSWETPDRWR